MVDREPGVGYNNVRNSLHQMWISDCQDYFYIKKLSLKTFYKLPCFLLMMFNGGPQFQNAAKIYHPLSEIIMAQSIFYIHMQ